MWLLASYGDGRRAEEGLRLRSLDDKISEAEENVSVEGCEGEAARGNCQLITSIP